VNDKSVDSSGRREYVLNLVNERTDPNGELGRNANSDLWTSPKRLRSDGAKASVPYSKDEIEDEYFAAVDDGDLIKFAGLLAPATSEHLRAILTAEEGSTRQILREKCKRLLEEKEAGSP